MMRAHGLVGARLPGVDRGRSAVAVRRDDLCGAEHAAAVRGRRVCVHSRRLRRFAGVPLHVDVVRRGKAGLDCEVTTGLARTLAIFPALHWLDGVAFHAGFAVLWSQVFAIAATWLMTGLNYLGIRKAGDFQLVFTWSEGRADSCHCGDLLWIAGRALGQLRDEIRWGARRFRRIHDRPDRGAMGLRRLERPDHGGRRSAKSGA